MLAALRPAIPPQELSLLWTRLGPIVLAKAEATQKQTSGEDVKLWVDAATLWQDLPTGADREALAGALLSVHHAELKRPAETSQGSEVNLCHALAKFLGDKPTELAAVRDELRKLFAGASKREDALFYGACWRALGGLNSRDAPALAAWLGEADSNAIIGGYSWEPPLTEILIGALGEIFTLSFTDRWGFTEWARKNHPELLRVSRPPRSDNVNPKAEAPVHPVS
jgi:hypothetical protein